MRKFEYRGHPAQSAIWKSTSVIERPDHDVSIRDVFRIYTPDRHEVARLLAIPQLSDSWRGWVEHLVHKGRG